MNKRCIDIIVLTVIIMAIVLGCLSDTILINYLPQWILIDSSIENDLKFSAFSAQVSISTLVIALLAILGGMFKEEIYGVNVVKYLTNDRPLIFKHKINIILQLILIFISYICISFNKYNTLISIFFVSILITIVMTWDIFNIFKGSKHLKVEIHNYIIDIFRKDKLENKKVRQSIIIELKKDTLINIENNNTTTLKDNLSLFNDILSIIVNYNYEDKNAVLEIFEESVSEIFNKIFEDKDTIRVMIALKSINSLYKTCNDSNSSKGNNKTYIDIYERVYFRIFSAIARLIVDDREDQNIIISLQYNLYNNMNFEVIQGNILPKNNTYLSLYSGRIYYEIKRRGLENYNIENVYSVKKKLFTTLDSYIKYYKFDEFKTEKINQVYMQLYQYTKVLIDNNEKDLLKELFFNKIRNINSYNNDIEDIKYIFIIIIYMYYIVEFEELVDISLKDEILMLLQCNKSNIYNFLISNYKFTFSKDIIKNIKRILESWEKMHQEGLKSIIMDSVIEKFILLYTLKINWNCESLINKLSPLLEGNEFSISSELNNKNDIFDEYIKFNELFFKNETSKEDAKDKINMLKYVISVLYKDSELEKSKEKIKSDKEYDIIKNDILDKVLENLESKIEKFMNKTIENYYDLSFSLEIDTDVDFINKNIIDKITCMSESFFILKIMNILDEKLKKDCISKGNKDLIVRFFELYDSLGIETDTLIGYCDYFYDEHDVKKFKKFEKSKMKLKSQYKRDCIVTIDSSKFYINVKNLEVEIKNIDIDELYKKLKLNENNEYMYNITNDIYIPFTKDELKTYIENTKRKIVIKYDIEYGFGEEYIGCGIFISSEKSS